MAVHVRVRMRVRALERFRNMAQSTWRRGIWAAAVAAAAVLAVAFSACSSSSTSEATKNANAISAISILDNAGLHATAASIAGGTVPPTAQTTAQHLQTVLLVTEWPTSQLKDDAGKLAAKMGAMAQSLNTDKPDMKAAAAAADAAHEGEHDFSHEVWDYLTGKAGVTPAAAASTTE
jgi:hypothetical protein